MNADLKPIINRIKKEYQNGKSYIIAIDGFGGSGKSSIANKLKAELTNAEIVQLDDFYSSQLGMADRSRLLEQVLIPLSQNKASKYQRYDWKLKKLTDWIEIKPGGIVIIEGVSSLHDQLANLFDLKIWIDVHQNEGHQRGLKRDLEEYHVDTTNEWLNVWLPQEKAYYESQNPLNKADIVLKN